jgi:hypothetical protein
VTGTLNVETAALVRQATGRHSDALACDAIGHYVGHVGAVPDAAWGSLAWAQKWKTEWHDAVQDRITEAGQASERLGDVGETLYQVAADYAHTDISVATDFSAISGTPIMAFVDALEHPAAATAHPGGHLNAPTAYTGGNYTVSIPDTSPTNHDLNILFHDAGINQEDLWPAGTDLSQTPRGKLRAEMMSEGRKKLWEFIGDWANDLGNAETIVRQWGLVTGESSLDFINQASDAWPQIIANRANLLKLGANAYRDLQTTMAGQVKDLQQYWTSPGAAGAYSIYADSLGDYYATIADNLQWLGEEGEKAANTIDQLQLDFANLGYAHIEIIAAQLQAYLDAANSISHAVDDPLKGLADAVTGLVSSLADSWKSAADKAQATTAISQTVVAAAPHFSDNNHAAARPPQSPSNTWRGKSWKP